MMLKTYQGPADMAAISAIVASVFNALPTILGILAGVMGVAWYCVLFYDRFIKKTNDEYSPPETKK